MIKVSIIIPTLNEQEYISLCLDSILSSNIDKDSIEIIIVDGESSDKTVEIVKEYMKKYNFIKLFTNKKKIIPIAMNIGIKEAKGEYIIRLDAHSIYPKNYITNLLFWAKKLDADNVGGICITDVKHKSKKTNSIKAALTHKLGIGGVSYKAKITTPKESNTVPFGCFKKESLDKFGYFDERLERTEDLELNKRFIDNGAKVFLVPEVEFTYFARDRFKDLAKKSFSTGKWIVMSAYISKSFKALHLHHFIPLIFVLSVVLPLLFCSINKIFCIFSQLSLISYISVILYTSFKLKNKNNSFLYIVATFIVLHISYGIGSIYGIYQVFRKVIKR